ncbi:MAG: hypothetical protein ACRCZO_19860, partial [Cetobacterium sp.]
LGADIVELDLHPALLADPFEVEHYPFAEFRMEHPLAELDAAGVEALLHLVLAEAARFVEHLAAVDAAALGITDVELLHGAGHVRKMAVPDFQIFLQMFVCGLDWRIDDKVSFLAALLPKSMQLEWN